MGRVANSTFRSRGEEADRVKNEVLTCRAQTSNADEHD